MQAPSQGRPQRRWIRSALARPWPVLVLVLGMGVGMSVLAPDAQAGLTTVAGEVLDIKADRLDVDVDEGQALLTGNVSARLGELTVDCPKVEIKYDEAPQVRWAKGSGGVEARLKGIVAKAETVEVDVTTRTVALQGKVRLTRGKGWVEAARARIDIKTSKVTLEGVKGSIPVEPPSR